MIRVMIVDDHRLVRVALTAMLTEARGIEVVGQAENGEDAISMARELTPNIALMDLRMPGIGGLEATRRLLRFDPGIRVIVVTACTEDPFPAQAIRAGAAGFLTKGASRDELIGAIRKVFLGQRCMSHHVAQHLALKAFEKETTTPFDLLSNRELQITMMVVACQKVQKISSDLHLSPKTVNSYRYRIFDKLNVRSDVELALLAARHGMVDLAARTATG